MNSMSKITAAGHLFNINPDVTKLPEDKAQLFHHLVAKLLYLCRHTRQDIQTGVALMRTTRYIRGTKELTIEPSADPKWWVDSLYSVHPDMRSHTGMVMSVGKGATYSTSTKQNSIQKALRRLKKWP